MYAYLQKLAYKVVNGQLTKAQVHKILGQKVWLQFCRVYEATIYFIVEVEKARKFSLNYQEVYAMVAVRRSQVLALSRELRTDGSRATTIADTPKMFLDGLAQCVDMDTTIAYAFDQLTLQFEDLGQYLTDTSPLGPQEHEKLNDINTMMSMMAGYVSTYSQNPIDLQLTNQMINSLKEVNTLYV